MVDNPAVDLVAAAKRLPPKFKNLSKKIIQLRDAQSVRTDLVLACDFTETMRAIREPAAHEGAGGHNENAFLALFYSAIILYVRATKSSSKHRGLFNIPSQYDEEQRATHKVLCDLRDDAIAHFGPGGVYRGPAFHKEGVFIPQGPGAFGKIMVASIRLVINGQLLDDLSVIAHRAQMIALQRSQTLNEEVTRMVGEELRSSGELFELLKPFVIDFASFTDDASAARDILTGPQAGYRRGTPRH